MTYLPTASDRITMTHRHPAPEDDPLLPYLPPEVVADLSPEQSREWAELQRHVRVVRENLHSLTTEVDKLAVAVAKQGQRQPEITEQDKVTDTAMFLAMHADSMRALLRDDFHRALDITKSADKYALPR